MTGASVGTGSGYLLTSSGVGLEGALFVKTVNAINAKTAMLAATKGLASSQPRSHADFGRVVVELVVVELVEKARPGRYQGRESLAWRCSSSLRRAIR